MKTQFQRYLLVCMTAGFGIIQCLPAVASRQGLASLETQSFIKGMRANWRSSQTLNTGSVTIDFEINDEGVIYDPVISRFSGNDQFDAECLETLCGLSPLEHGPLWGLDLSLEHISIALGTGIKPSKDAPEITEYLKEHPAHDGSVIVHRIPPFILSRYPGLITEEEFLSPKNLIRIASGVRVSIDNAGQRLSQPEYVWAVRTLNGWWSKSLPHLGPVTKKTILEHAEAVSSQLKLGDGECLHHP